MTRAEILAYNAGVTALAEIASASADALHQRLTLAPTRYGFAIGALEGIVEAAADVMLRLPPDGTNAASPPQPLAPALGASEGSDQARCKETANGC